jgi:hypothetical protein
MFSDRFGFRPRRAFWAAVALGMASAFACSSAKSSNGGGGTSGGGSGGCAKTSCPTLDQCAQAHCAAQVQACESPCAALTTCITNCGTCATTACADNCASKNTQACSSCETTLGQCEEQNCLSQLQSCSASDGGVE